MMTDNAFAWGVPARRATFVPSASEIALRRLRVGVSVAAVVVSAISVGVVAPLVF